MTDPVDRCVFCGDTDLSRITKEHLWPRWCHREITRSMRKWNGIHAIQRIETDTIDAGDIRTLKRGGDIHDFQVPCVCGGNRRSCNAGWMKDIEDRAKPIMIPLMNGRPARLTADEQNVVAAWAALKAMVSEYAPLGSITTPQAERDLMRLTSLPPHRSWAIWIGHYQRGEWPGFLGANPFVYLPGRENEHLLGIPRTDYNGQASFQVLKKLFIQVVRCRVPELVEKWRFDHGASKFLRKIWPPSGFGIVWPPPTMSDKDADYVATAFVQTVTSAVRRNLSRAPGGHEAPRQ